MKPPDWEQAPEFGRREMLLLALRRLWELRRGPACIVETGTLRNDSPTGRDGDGWSTVAWGWYCACVGGRVYTVDCDAGNLEVCRRVTAPYAAAIEYVHSDSVEFLRAWSEEAISASRLLPFAFRPSPHTGKLFAFPKIDLLYLDSFDYLDREGSEAHNLAEARAALPHLAGVCLVLIDDTHPAGEPDAQGVPPFSGKGALTVPFLRERGFALEFFAGGQVLLSRGE
jgi:hypothetical protein